jgi:hypothetical protein
VRHLAAGHVLCIQTAEDPEWTQSWDGHGPGEQREAGDSGSILAPLVAATRTLPWSQPSGIVLSCSASCINPVDASSGPFISSPLPAAWEWTLCCYLVAPEV